MKLYQYPKCSSCRKAVKFLEQRGIEIQTLNIAEQAPSKTELKTMLAAYLGDLRKLFNTSGGLYRELKLKDKMATITESEAFDLLTSNGMLVKRPFLLHKHGALVGFNESQWQALLDG